MPKIAPTNDPSDTATLALRASEMRYRRLFESAKDGILIVEADSGQIIDANPYLADLLGYSRADFLGKYLWDFGPFKDVVATKEAFAELQSTDYVAYEDLPLEAHDGRLIDVGLVSNVYLVGETRIIQCNIRDITNRKVQERERLSLEEQLRVSQKMEAIGGLASGIAHDFNNLLSIILCYTDFVLEALPADSPLCDDLSEVKKASRLAVALTRQLLAFGRKQVLQPVVFDLNHTVDGIDKMLQRILGEDVELVHILEPNLGLVMADPGQLEQVIMNLVINARDAMPRGGRMTLETKNVELDAEYAALHVGATTGPHIMLAISDSGCGMSPETQSRVFEPFFTTKEPGRGTGLGLSTVYGIVKQSGGSVGLYSELGLGTTVRIYLPRELPQETSEASPSANETSDHPPATETILVVEDEAAVRSLAHRILSAAGYTVLTASNGHDALILFDAHEGEIPLVLSDVVMPQVGGRIFAAQVQRLRPKTKILFMSGYSGDAILHRGLLDDGVDLIGKPFSGADLKRKVRTMLDRKPGKAQSTSA